MVVGSAIQYSHSRQISGARESLPAPLLAIASSERRKMNHDTGLPHALQEAKTLTRELRTTTTRPAAHVP